MSKNSNDNINITSITDEVKDQNNKFNLNKFELNLFYDEKNVAEKVLRVKRFSLPGKGEKWKIFEDNKVVFTLEGNKLTVKEKDFLRTVDGFNFLLSKYKEGIKSFNALKQEIKGKIKNNEAP